jgi:hypothetical protein
MRSVSIFLLQVETPAISGITPMRDSKERKIPGYHFEGALLQNAIHPSILDISNTQAQSAKRVFRQLASSASSALKRRGKESHIPELNWTLEISREQLAHIQQPRHTSRDIRNRDLARDSAPNFLDTLNSSHQTSWLGL